MTAGDERAVITFYEPEPVPLRGTLIVLPGRGESAQVYARFGRRLAADAYRVHVVAAPSSSPGLAREQVDGLLKDASPDTARVLVGSDGGAAFAAHLAASADPPDVSALILAGLPTTPGAAEARGWEEELDARSSCPTHRARINQTGVRRAALFTDLPAEWFPPAGRITLPVLGVHGRDDDVSPVGAARDWYAATPRAELVTIAGGRHDALNDQTHRTVAASIVLFLERLRGGPALAPIAVTENAERTPA
jgi:pimeloyl-ACP methyl ester carboxylesterase